MEKIYKSGDRLTAVLHKPGILLRKKNYVSELPACAKLQTVIGHFKRQHRADKKTYSLEEKPKIR
jgi:hypothetical protein